MKNIKFFLVLTILALSLGCDKFLEEDLRDEITPQEFYSNDQEAILATNGAYRLLRSPDLYRTRGLDDYYVFGTDEVEPSRIQKSEINNYLIAEGVEDGNALWDKCYEIVRNTSLSISRIESNEGLSKEVKDQTLGENYFLRSLAYFHLTNLWGDVPYFRKLLPLNELEVLQRFPKDQIREDMKEDLTLAASLLPSKPSNGRASKWAAEALKAKYHLYDKEWLKAKTACDNIINGSHHRLLDNFADVFDQTDPANQYNDEHIFVVDFSTDLTFPDSNTSRTDIYNPRINDEPKNGGQRGALRNALTAVDQAFTGFGLGIPKIELADQANWEAGDLRYDATIVTEHLGFELKFPYFRKNWNVNISSPRSNHHENYIVFRLADIYLMAAEAENELNGPTNAYFYVNKVRERAFDPDKPWSGLSKETFREKMYDERKFELCTEGHRKMDLVRWGILVETIKNTVHRPFLNPDENIQSYHVKLPIPLREIILNPNLLLTDPTNNGYRSN